MMDDQALMPASESHPAHSGAVVIARRFRGPPDSANGGYACGLVASRLEGTARVRLHLPPPLETPLSIRATDGAGVALVDAEQVVAQGIVVPAHGEPPGPVDFDAAVQASEKYRWFTGHPFPGCFVCGPDRHAGDGLCIFPGPVAGRQLVAAPWIPDDSVCDASGHVQPEVVWAALDCPSWFGLLEFESGTTTGLLGQLSAQLLRRPRAHERCVVTGWGVGREGRKLHAGAALYTSDGVLLGSSAATWIEPKA
jgi:hypothetical protein